MSRWTVNARTLFFDGRPFVHLNKEGDTRPTEADGAARLVADLFNREGVTPESIFERHMSLKPRGRGPVREVAEVAERKFSMTYGQLPPLKQFEHDIRTRIDPDYDRPYLPKGTDYPMELVSREEIELAEKFGELEEFGTSRPGYAYGFKGDPRTIYKFLKFLVRRNEMGNEAAGDLASSIMYTLGYEWI